MRAPGAALIEQKGVIARRIEKRAVRVLRAAARSAVQEHDRAAAPGADLFDVNPMAVAGADHARVEGAELVC